MSNENLSAKKPLLADKDQTDSSQDPSIIKANKSSAEGKKFSLAEQLTLPTTFGLAAWGGFFDRKDLSKNAINTSLWQKGGYLAPQIAMFVFIGLIGFLAFKKFFEFVDDYRFKPTSLENAPEGVELTPAQKKTQTESTIAHVTSIAIFPLVIWTLESMAMHDQYIHLAHGNGLLFSQSLVTLSLGLLFAVVIPQLIDRKNKTGKFSDDPKVAEREADKPLAEKADPIIKMIMGTAMFAGFPALNMGIEALGIKKGGISALSTGAIYFAYAAFMTVIIPAVIKYAMAEKKEDTDGYDWRKAFSEPTTFN